MSETTTGRWAQIRARTVNTPELQERYERTRHTLGLTRELLMQIDAERERVGLTKAELARRIGTSPSVLRRLFSSESSNPTLRTVLEMLEVLGFDLELKPARRGKRRVPAQVNPRRLTQGAEVV